ncbi:hypothetical protein N7467_011852 [Penicillium canescens]|nr:hypothetical protein N7467_011852 [Penicillium canescens]
MCLCASQFGEDMFQAKKASLGIDIYHCEGVNVTGGLGIGASLRGPLIVFEIMPSALQNRGVNWIRVTVARKNARTAHTEQVDKVTLRDIEKNRSKPDIWGLGHPKLFLKVQAQDSGYH